MSKLRADSAKERRKSLKTPFLYTAAAPRSLDFDATPGEDDRMECRLPPAVVMSPSPWRYSPAVSRLDGPAPLRASLSRRRSTADESSLGTVMTDRTSTLAEAGHEISTLEACFTISNGVIGVGVLSLPFAFAQSGLCCVAICIGSTFLYAYTGRLVGKCMEATTAYCHARHLPPFSQDWPLVGWLAFGSIGQLCVTAALVLELWCVLLSAMILVGANLHELIPALPREVAIMLCGASALLLLFTPHKLLAAFSLMSNLAVLTAVGALVWSGSLTPDRPAYSELKMLDLNGLATSFGVINFCFVAHAVFPTVYARMKNPRSSFNHACDISFVIAFLCYTGTGLYGYLTYGENVAQVFSLNLGKTVKGEPIPGLAFLPRIAITAMVVKLEGTIPLWTAPLLLKGEQWLGLSPLPDCTFATDPELPRAETPVLTYEGPNLAASQQRDNESRSQKGVKRKPEEPEGDELPSRLLRFKKGMFRIAFCVFTTLLAMMLKDAVADIQAFTGCLFSMQTCCLFPVLCYWGIEGKQRVVSFGERIFLICVLIFGLAVMIPGTIINAAILVRAVIASVKDFAHSLG